MQKQQTDGERALFVRDVPWKIAPRFEATVGDLVRPPLEMQLDDAGANHRRRRQRWIGRERRDDLDLPSTFEGRFARPSGVRFGEREQRPNPVVVLTLIARSPFELAERLDREIGFARRQLRLTELEHQWILGVGAFA